MHRRRRSDSILKTTTRTLLLLLAGTLVLAGSARALLPDRRPNVLWISVDAWRPDRLPLSGRRDLATPVLDVLAGRGVVFERAFTDVPWTTASMASALTGKVAPRHGLRTPFQRLPEANETLAEVLSAGGFQTAAIVGSVALDSTLRLDRGFDVYDDRCDTAVDGGVGAPHMPSEFHEDVDLQRTYRLRKLRRDSFRGDAAVADAAVGWLRRASRMRPFFLWVHFYGPGRRAPRGAAPAEIRALVASSYDERVAEVDEQIGRILAEIAARGELERTIVVLHGTAGDDLGTRPIFAGMSSLDDVAIHVPLVIAAPSLPSGVRIGSQVRMIDVLPTVLDLLGVGAPPGLDGASLRPLPGEGEGEGRVVVAENLLGAEAGLFSFRSDGAAAVPGIWRRAVRTGRWKYVVDEPVPFINYGKPPPLPADAERYRRAALYDLVADPGERRDVAAQHPEIAAELAGHLRKLPPWPADGA